MTASMSNLPSLTDDDFQATVAGSSTPVLVDFSATWCQPCKALEPTIEKVASEYGGRLSVFHVDIEEAEASARALDVRGVPTCVLFKGGKEVDRFQGNQDIAVIRARVEKLM